MPTVVLDAYTKAYPSITNRIRAAVFTQDDPLAPVATIIDTTVGHPQRIYHFPGLPRENYDFSLDEIDGGGVPINNLAKFSVVPSKIDGLLTRNDEQITVGTTTGFDAGLQTVTFDGIGGKPNYIGWSIVPSELTGRGILVKGLDYTWDSVTGVFTWLQDGDILQYGTNYNIHFDPIIDPAGWSVPMINDFSIRLITATGNINVSDFGNAILSEPAGNYIEAILPDITTVPIGRALTVFMKEQIGNNVQCMRIIPFEADVIKFARGKIWMHNNESLKIFRYRRADLSNEWRVIDPCGNFLTVGQNVSEDFTQSLCFLRQLMDGSIKNKNQFARIYNEVVLTLPSNQRCSFDDWSTGNNKYLFSLADSADIDNVDKFHFPDRRGLIERNNNTGKAGDFGDQSVQDHAHRVWGRDNTAPPVNNAVDEVGNVENPPVNEAVPVAPALRFRLTGAIPNNTGKETLPKHYLINKYVLI